MRRIRSHLLGLLVVGVVLLGGGAAARAEGWTSFCDAAIKKGAQHCAIYGLDGQKWGAAGPAFTIRDVRTLISDVKAGRPTDELRFDNNKYMFLGKVDAAIVGKKGDNACAVQLSNKAVVIVIA